METKDNTIEITEEMKQEQAVKDWLRELFSFPRIANDKTNELVTGMASLLHAAATMVIKTESRQREGMEAISHLQQALLYYISAQAVQREEKKEEVAEEDLKS
jgi:hypothetical protein